MNKVEELRQGYNSGLNIPDYAIERMAKVMLPRMQRFFASEEGKKMLAELEKADSGKASIPQPSDAA